MNSYYYGPQQSLLKQSSQVLASLPLPHQLPAHLVRSTLTDRPSQEAKSPYLHPPQALQSHLARQSSAAHLVEAHSGGALSGRSSAGENQRICSEYQMGGGRGEQGQLPSGGGYNVTGSKIGEKVKNKTELHKSNSRNALTLADSHHRASEREGRVDAALEMLTGEVGRLTERVAQQEERVAKAEERLERAEKSAAFSSPQMEEISKILSLVEKSEQRDDYKRAIRMIDELRGNILDLHTQIKQVQTYPDPLPPHLTETLTEMVATAISSGEAEIRRRVEADMAEMKERAAGLEREWEEWRKGEGVVGEVGETRRFEGRMTTLQYEQRVSWQAAEKENGCVVLTSRTYYLDSSGFLLDKNQFYLLNSTNQQIRLTQKEIVLLRKHAIL